jgi:type III restriction enzyme
MDNQFFEKPILNSPYEYPRRHWELDKGQPTQKITEARRRVELITPIPKARKRTAPTDQSSLLFDEGLSTQQQLYAHTAIIGGVREQVDRWRSLPSRSKTGCGSCNRTIRTATTPIENSFPATCWRTSSGRRS